MINNIVEVEKKIVLTDIDIYWYVRYSDDSSTRVSICGAYQDEPIYGNVVVGYDEDEEPIVENRLIIDFKATVEKYVANGYTLVDERTGCEKPKPEPPVVVV